MLTAIGAQLAAPTDRRRLDDQGHHSPALANAEIERYVATGESFDKAGGYAVQGLAAAFIRRIEGSYSGVMGLPLYETAQALAQAGFPML